MDNTTENIHDISNLFFNITKDELIELLDNGLITEEEIGIFYSDLKCHSKSKFKVFENTLFEYIKYLFDQISCELKSNNKDNARYILASLVSIPKYIFMSEGIYDKYCNLLKENMERIYDPLIISEYYTILFDPLDNREGEFANDVLGGILVELCRFNIYQSQKISDIRDHLETLVYDYLFLFNKFKTNDEDIKDILKGYLLAISISTTNDAKWYARAYMLENKMMQNASPENINNFVTFLIDAGFSKEAFNYLPGITFLKICFAEDFQNLKQMEEKFSSIYEYLINNPTFISYETLNIMTDNNIIKAVDIDYFLAKYYFLYYSEPIKFNDEFIENTKKLPLIPLCLMDVFSKANNFSNEVESEAFFNEYIKDVFVENQAKWLTIGGFPIIEIIRNNYGEDYLDNVCDDFTISKKCCDYFFSNSKYFLGMNNAEKNIYKFLGDEETYKEAIKEKNNSNFKRAAELFKLIPNYKVMNNNNLNFSKKYEKKNKSKIYIYEWDKENNSSTKDKKNDIKYGILMALFGLFPLFVSIGLFSSGQRKVAFYGIIPSIVFVLFESVGIGYLIKGFKK